jgi:hypothetical protein
LGSCGRGEQNRDDQPNSKPSDRSQILLLSFVPAGLEAEYRPRCLIYPA